MNLGTPELLIILVIAVLVFGSRLPKIARSLGQAQNEFKKGSKETHAQTDDDEVDKKS